MKLTILAGALCAIALLSACGGGGGDTFNEVGRGEPIARFAPLSTLPVSVAEPGAGATTNPETLLKDLEAFRIRSFLPGLSVVVVDGERIISAQTGLRRADETDPIQPSDKFYIGSLTKAVTATLTAKFVEEGKLRWDSTLGELLPDLKNEMHPWWHTITIDKLLRHMSGIENGPTMLDAEKLIPLQTDDIDQNAVVGAKFALTKPPEFTDGKFHYSSLDIIIVGMVLERLGGANYSTLLRNHLLNPLGIEADLGYQKAVKPGMWGHNLPVNGLKWEPVEALHYDYLFFRMTNSAGGLRLNMANYGLYLRDQLRGLNGKPALMKNQGSYVAAHTPVEGQAYGWNVLSDPKLGKVSVHGGYLGHYIAYAMIAPEKNLSVAISCNCSAYGVQLMESYVSQLAFQVAQKR